MATFSALFEQFDAWLGGKAGLMPPELEQIRSLAVPRRYRKRQFLLTEGDVCLYKSFIVTGLFKTSIIREDGTEVVLRFNPELTWMVDPESYNFQRPSRFYIEALEDAEVLQWSHPNVQQLMKDIPRFQAYSEDLILRNLNASQDRILQSISLTSEEKYEKFVAAYPDVFRRVPLHMVASYLGVSRETLSRIRQQQVKQARN